MGLPKRPWFFWYGNCGGLSLAHLGNGSGLCGLLFRGVPIGIFCFGGECRFRWSLRLAGVVVVHVHVCVVLFMLRDLLGRLIRLGLCFFFNLLWAPRGPRLQRCRGLCWYVNGTFFVSTGEL